MVLCESAEVLKDSRLQISAGAISSITGLSRDQAYRAMAGLEKALITVMKSGVLTENEFISFRINKETGLSSFYEFEYRTPQINKKIGVAIENETTQTKPSSYDKNADIMYKHKATELKRLGDIFSNAELNQFLKYDLFRIVFVIDYYFAQVAGPPPKTLSFTWLKKAFEDNYNISPNKTRERMLQEVSWLNSLHKEISSLADQNKITFKHLKISVNGAAAPPKFVFSSFTHAAKLQDEFENNLARLNDMQLAELEEVTPKIYKALWEKFGKVAIDTYEKAERHIKYSVIAKHFNLI